MQVLINILYSFSLILCIGLSFYIIYFSVKFFHMAHAVIITLGAYLTLFFSQQLLFSIFMSVIFSVISCIILGLLMEILLYKELRKRRTTSFVYLVSSLGLYAVIQNLISIIWGDGSRSFRNGNVSEGNDILGAHITNVQLLMITLSILIFIGLYYFLNNVKIGKNMRAVSENTILSTIFGINQEKVFLWAFSIGSGLASLVGILVAFDTDMTPTMGFKLFLYGIVAMIIGGIGSLWGLVGGSLLLAIAQHLGAYYIDSKWMDAIAYLVLILFLIWKPLGFSGKRLKKVDI
jgi:branched-chain amino acid transport system permease protein